MCHGRGNMPGAEKPPSDARHRKGHKSFGSKGNGRFGWNEGRTVTRLTQGFWSPSWLSPEMQNAPRFIRRDYNLHELYPHPASGSKLN